MRGTMTMHGRLPWPTPGELDAAQRDLYDRIAGGPRAAGKQAFPLTDADGRLNGPFNAMLMSPDVGAAMQELGSVIRYKTTLSDRVREIAILEVAVYRRSEFEWYAHVRVAEQIGLTSDELTAILGGEAAPTLSAEETLVRSVVQHLARERDLDDAAYASAVAALGLQALIDVIALVGYYDLLALTLRACRTPLPAGAAAVFS